MCFNLAWIDRTEALRVATRWSHEPEDLLQSALLRAWQNRDAYRETQGGSPRGWFYHLMRNIAISESRKHKPEVLDTVNEGSCYPDDTLAEQAITRAIGDLPEGYRAVVEKRVNGSSYATIARELGIPEGTVMSRLFRARGKLQEMGVGNG